MSKNSSSNKLRTVLHRTSKKELPHHKSGRLEGGTHTHTHTQSQQASLWLSKTTDDTDPWKAMTKTNLPKPVEVALPQQGKILPRTLISCYNAPAT